MNFKISYVSITDGLLSESTVFNFF